MNNETYYEVFSRAESVCFVIYFILIIIFGGIGNIFIIHASRSYSSFDLDRVTIMFVQHLAIADFLKILFMTIPMLANHFYYMTHPDEFEWYLPNYLGQIGYFLHAMTNVSVGLFISAVSVHRLVRCLAPTKLRQSGKKGVRTVMGLLWFLAVLFGSVVLFLPFTYKMNVTLCSLDLTKKLSPLLQNLSEYTNYPLMTTMTIVVILANLTSLIYTCILTRDNPNTNFRQANLTVLAISLGMIVCYSWLPSVMIGMYSMPAAERAKPDVLPSSILKYAVPLTTASSLINPVLYTVVNKGFKRFAVKEVKKIFGNLSSVSG